jgi:hypothetical protein
MTHNDLAGAVWGPSVGPPAQLVQASQLKQLGAVGGRTYYAWPAREAELVSRGARVLSPGDAAPGSTVIHSATWTPARAERPLEGATRGQTIHTPAAERHEYLVATEVPAGSYSAARDEHAAKAVVIGAEVAEQKRRRTLSLARGIRLARWQRGEISAQERDADD